MIPYAAAKGLSGRIASESGFPEWGPEQRAILRACLEMHRLILREVGGAPERDHHA